MPNSSRLQLLSLLYTRPLLLPPSFSCSLPSIQQMNCLCGGLESVAEVIGLRQGHVCLELQGAECQSGLFSFQPRHLKNFKGGRDRRRGTLTQTEKLCFPSHFNNTLNLWSGLNPSPSGNYRDDFVRASCSGHSVQPNTAFLSLKKKKKAAQSGSCNGADLGSGCRDTPVEVWGQCACSVPRCGSAALQFVTSSRSHVVHSVWSTACRTVQTLWYQWV